MFHSKKSILNISVSLAIVGLLVGCKNPPLELLKDGKIESWNEWRQKNPGDLDLNGIDLSRLDLRYTNFNKVDFSNSNLAGSDLRGAKAEETKWHKTKLSGARIPIEWKPRLVSATGDAHWQYSPAHQAKVFQKGATAWNAWRKKFPNAQVDLTGQVFKNLALKGYDLSGANLRGGGFLNVSFAGANLTGADLRESDFSRINFNGANLQKARLGASDMRFASFVNADFRKAIIAEIVDGTNVIRADLRGANLAGADLTGAQVTVKHPETQKNVGARLTSVKVGGAKIPIKYKGFFRKQNAKGTPVWIN